MTTKKTDTIVLEYALLGYLHESTRDTDWLWAVDLEESYCGDKIYINATATLIALPEVQICPQVRLTRPRREFRFNEADTFRTIVSVGHEIVNRVREAERQRINARST